MPRAKVSGSTVYLSKEQIKFIKQALDSFEETLTINAHFSCEGLCPNDQKMIEELEEKLGGL